MGHSMGQTASPVDQCYGSIKASSGMCSSATWGCHEQASGPSSGDGTCLGQPGLAGCVVDPGQARRDVSLIQVRPGGTRR
eukprot:365114-Chlamydomonas_euryale.AAC.8